MPFDANQFVNANQFGDSSFYSGMGGQMKSLTEAAQEAALAEAIGGASAGVAPPQTFGDFAQQRFNKAVAPVTQAYNKASNVVDQIGQGNAVGAVNAYQGNNAQTAQQTAPSTSSSGGFDYSINPFRKTVQ